MLLARRISFAKWDTTNRPEGEIAADAVTGDLRTKGNAVSFWRCRSDAAADVADVALAIAASGDRIDRLHIVLVPECEIRADGHPVKKTEGQTAAAGMSDRHVDVCSLDYVRLGGVARHVAAAIAGERYRRFKPSEVKALLVAAAQEKRIDFARLDDRIESEIRKPTSA